MLDQENSANNQAETQSPLSVQEFSKKIKEKYPSYKDVDDITLAQKIIEKYPEYKGRVSFEETPVPSSTQSVPTPGQYSQWQTEFEKNKNTEQPVDPAITAMKAERERVASGPTPFENYQRESTLHAAKGVANTIYRGLINIPDNAMRITALGTNPIAKILGIPEYNPGDINEVTGLSNVDDYLSNQSKIYQNEIEKINPRINEGTFKALQSGDINQAFKNLSGGLVESFFPSMMMMGLPMASVGKLGQIAGSTAMFGTARLKELDDNYPELSEPQKLIAGNVNGFLEGWFETYFGSGAVGSAMAKSILQKEGVNLGSEVIKKGIGEMFTNLLTKYPALAPFGEMYEEMGTQITQNLTDKFTGVSPDISVTENMWDSGILGFFGGATHGGMIKGVQILANSAQKGANSYKNVAARTQAKKEHEASTLKFRDIPNANYTEAVENIVNNYTDPQQITEAFNQISTEFGVNQSDYTNAFNFLKVLILLLFEVRLSLFFG